MQRFDFLLKSSSGVNEEDFGKKLKRWVKF